MSPKLTPDVVSPTSTPSTAKFGVWSLTLLGLGSILGTGVFVGIGIAANVAGTGAIAAVVLAAIVALGNELSTIQLSINGSAASGTYEYGQKYLSPWLRFTAGWAFLLAKIASAATAALGFAGYLLNALGQTEILWLMPVALSLVALLMLILLQGLHHASFSRRFMLAVTLLSLLVFLGAAWLGSRLGAELPAALPRDRLAFIGVNWIFTDGETGDWDFAIATTLQATALMCVAYAGYGRMAYLSHAVRQPRRTLPASALVTLAGVMLLYLGVAIVTLETLSAGALDGAVGAYIAPLAIAVRQLGLPGIAPLVTMGALTALLTMLLNLMLDCAQMLQSMAQQQDLPRSFARFNAAGTTPTLAVLAVGGAIVCFMGMGDVKSIWSFSAFSLLIYSAITHWAVLKLSARARLYPRLFTQLGLLVCLFLAFWVDWQIWLVSLGLLIVGLIWRGINQWVDEQSQD